MNKKLSINYLSSTSVDLGVQRNSNSLPKDVYTPSKCSRKFIVFQNRQTMKDPGSLLVHRLVTRAFSKQRNDFGIRARDVKGSLGAFGE